MRTERKDYVDLMTLLLEGVSLSSALSAAQALSEAAAAVHTVTPMALAGDRVDAHHAT